MHLLKDPLFTARPTDNWLPVPLSHAQGVYKVSRLKSRVYSLVSTVSCLQSRVYSLVSQKFHVHQDSCLQSLVSTNSRGYKVSCLHSLVSSQSRFYFRVDDHCTFLQKQLLAPLFSPNHWPSLRPSSPVLAVCSPAREFETQLQNLVHLGNFS